MILKFKICFRIIRMMIIYNHKFLFSMIITSRYINTIGSLSFEVSPAFHQTYIEVHNASVKLIDCLTTHFEP